MHTRYAPVRRSSADCKQSLLPLDLHVLSLPLAFILSQDQTLRCCFFINFHNILKLTWSKWFYSLVSFDTRCHSYFNFFNERSLIQKIVNNFSILSILADANIKPFLHPTRGFSVLFLKKKRNKSNY